MLKDHTRKVLEDFVLAVEQSARANKGGDIEGFSSKINVSENSISISLEMAEHLFYQDEGVKGLTSSAKAPNSRFRFGTGNGERGLVPAIERWVKSKRIQFRNYKTGRFMTYKETARTAAYFIYNKGLKPSKFMTKALQKEFKTLPDEIIEAYGLDVNTFLQFAFKDNIKSFK